MARRRRSDRAQNIKQRRFSFCRRLRLIVTPLARGSMRVAQLQRLTRACGVAYPPSVQLRTTVSETGPAAQLSVGDSLTTERVFGHDDVRTYCMLTGDSNPIHTDKARTGDVSLDSFRLAALSESPVCRLPHVPRD